MAENAYTSHPSVGAQLRAVVATVDGKADPLLCSQTLPTQVAVSKALVEDDWAITAVMGNPSGATATNWSVELKKSGPRWKMTNVTCSN